MKKSIFLTGVTGNIGARLLELLLEDTKISKIFLLIRADSNDNGMHRLTNALSKSSESIDWNLIEQKVNIVCGDMCKPKLGLSDDVYEKLSKNITHIIHAAADTRFTVAIDKIRLTNLEGTKAIVKLAKQARLNSHFKGLAYISTAFVNGETRKILDEQVLLDNPKFHNTYEQSKWETEKYLRSVKSEIPICIFRPSIVVGDSQTGRLVHYNVLYTPLRILRAKSIPVIFAGSKIKLDIVPVDYVARGIKTLFVDNTTFENSTYNLVSGLNHSPTLKDLISKVSNQSIHFIPNFFYRLFKPLIKRKYSKLATILDSFMPYIQSGIGFKTEDTNRLLSKHNISCPDTNQYITVIIKHFFTDLPIPRLRKAV